MWERGGGQEKNRDQPESARPEGARSAKHSDTVSVVNMSKSDTTK